MGEPRQQPETSSPVHVRPGATLGRYELLLSIAAGGMARVWAARLRGHGGFSKLVALKMILPDFANDIEFQQMFFDEARIAAKVRHGHVCETFDLGDHEGVLYLAMEWVDGPSLLRLMRVESPDPARKDDAFYRRTIPPRLAARLLADACAGLHAAHELVDDDGTPLGVVHRDVSPHNILVSATGEVKVTDFGVAKAVGKSHATMAGHIKGKVSYMSPEQIRSSPTVDRRSDLFGLGCVLYEITTGRRPYYGDNDGELVASILAGRHTSPTELVPAYPEALVAIVDRALASDPTKRYQTAEEMRAALEEFLAASGPPIGANAIIELLRERCGTEMDRQREQIQRACASPRATPAAAWSTSSRPPSQPPANRGSDRPDRPEGSGSRPRLSASPPATTRERPSHVSASGRSAGAMAGTLPVGGSDPLKATLPVGGSRDLQATLPVGGSDPLQAPHPRGGSEPFKATLPLGGSGPRPPLASAPPLAPPPGFAASRASGLAPAPPPGGLPPGPGQPGGLPPGPGQPGSSLAPAPLVGTFSGPPGMYPPSDVASLEATAVRLPSSPPAARSILGVLLVGGLALSAALAAGGAWLLQARAHEARAAASPAPLVAAPPALVEGSGRVTAAPTAAVREQAPSRVTFRVTPPEAVLVVDGVTLPEGVHTVQRPTDGRPIRVRIHAERFEDVTETIDPNSLPVVVVTLLPSPGNKRPARRPGAAAPNPSSTGSALPNPY